jgi:glycosyltransferase involved in cell wall biosynthesis
MVSWRHITLKIAILTQYPLDSENIRGGVESSMIGLIKELKKFDDLQLHVVTSTKFINTDKVVYDGNLTIHYLSSPKFPQLFTSLTFDQYKLKRKIWEINPDLVNAHMTAPIYGFPALKTKYPVILTVHGVVSEEANTWGGLLGLVKRKIFVPMENYTLNKAKSIVTVSPYVAKKIKNKCNGNIHIIPNGINSERFKIENNAVDNRLLVVGGIEPRKGLINLLTAITIVKKENPFVKLHIVGKVRDKQYFNSLINYVKQNSLQNQVIFKGPLSDEELNAEYSECSIFVFPSREESQGIVLLEAMATGKAVVATNIGGIPYVVENYVTGRLVEYGDIQELAKAINTLIGDKNLRQMFGTNGQKRAKLFLNEEISTNYYKLYKDVGG